RKRQRGEQHTGGGVAPSFLGDIQPAEKRGKDIEGMESWDQGQLDRNEGRVAAPNIAAAALQEDRQQGEIFSGDSNDHTTTTPHTRETNDNMEETNSVPGFPCAPAGSTIP
ncbi:unnamed protein product, partial [Discosporangium mesarthrocarpum]